MTLLIHHACITQSQCFSCLVVWQNTKAVMFAQVECRVNPKIAIQNVKKNFNLPRFITISLFYLNPKFREVPFDRVILVARSFEYNIIYLSLKMCYCVFVYSVCRPKLIVNICINWLPVIMNLSVILGSQYSLNSFLLSNKCKKN